MAKKILVVDDEYYMHRLMQHHLLRAGYEMITAKNGREAVEKATNETPDLVIMDVMMAEMDGLSALKQLKQTQNTREIPVIMITAHDQPALREQAAAAGALHFVAKDNLIELQLIISQLAAIASEAAKRKNCEENR